MKILFFSDIHLALGPREPIRPEMRRWWRRFGVTGQRFMDRFEDRLRVEAECVREVVGRWMDKHDSEYDLLINGGDLAMPLSQHKDRLASAKAVWSDELIRYGESNYIALTGNHELGHGYDVDPDGYEDLLELRRDLFHGDTNRRGYGIHIVDETILLFLDSELLQLAKLVPHEPVVHRHMRAMTKFVSMAARLPYPIVVFTHNTARVRRWMRDQLPYWADLIAGGRRLVIIGGHYHVSRSLYRDGAEIHWSGGGSYPEPYMRYLVRVPFTGVHLGGPGAVEVIIEEDLLLVRHRPFGVHMGIFLHARRWGKRSLEKISESISGIAARRLP